MKTHTVTLSGRPRRQSRGLVVLLIAVALVGINRVPDSAAARGAGTQSAVVLQTTTVPMLAGTSQLINNGPGTQTNPHVDCGLASYTNDDFEGASTIHYFDFSTGTDNVIPGNGLNRLSDISGTRIAFTEFTALGDQIVVFDMTTQTRTVVPGVRRSNSVLGGNLVSFEDRSHTDPSQSEIYVYDLGTGTETRLTDDALFDKNPAISPTGNAVVWEKCQTDGAGCDIYAAIQTTPGVFNTRALTAAGGDEHFPATDGQVVVYASNRSGENDIYFQPAGGGIETQLAIPGDQYYPRVSGNLITFLSRVQAGGYDIFVYDLGSGSLYQVTDTPNFDETLNDINVCGDTGRIVYAVPGVWGDFDVHAFTFKLPSSAPAQINDLIALVRSSRLPRGIENSLLTKLQDALAALGASDTATACDSLRAFVNESSAQSGKKLTAEQSGQLIDSAARIRTGLGCH